MAQVALSKRIVCDEWDWLQDPVGQDLSVAENAARLVSDCEELGYDHLHAGIPCSTFSPLLCLRGRQLRLRHQPLGKDGLSEAQVAKVQAADHLIEVTIGASLAVFHRGGQVTWENVSDRGDPDMPCYWPARAGMCPLSLHPTAAAAMEYMGMVRIDLPFCSLDPGGPQKWVSVWATHRASEVLRPLRNCRCDHRAEEHGEALGRDASGESLAAATASYPIQFGWWLTEVPIQCRAAPEGSEVVWGPALHPAMREAVAEARRTALPFASFRKLTPMPLDQRWAAALPEPHAVEPEWEGGAPDFEGSVEESGSDDERPATWPAGACRPPRPRCMAVPGAPPRPIHYSQLWRCVEEEGGRRVGYDTVVAWTDEASHDRDPGTIAVPASLKEEWAREVVWDCRDPSDCVPVRQSSRHTVFAGSRQCDRAALREMADQVGWHAIDPDIVSQAGEGGLESRSHVGRYTVLEFPHRGYTSNFDAANEVAIQEVNDEWLLGPFALPPFEPMRCLPNNVVLTERLKADSMGVLRMATKARVTTDASSFRTDPVNGGVSRRNRTIAMPSAQTHAAGVGVTDAIVRRGSPSQAEEYCTDQCSAYSFFLMQRACWWQQCGYLRVVRPVTGTARGFYVRPRLVFGGAFGPNRFGRLSRLKRARVRQRQVQFDAVCPLPEGIQAVLRERVALQRAGSLPAGRDQVTLGYLQAFLDDESGSTANDPVPHMPEGVNVSQPDQPRFIDVAAFLAHTVAEGGRASTAGTRVVAHCCLSIDTSLLLGLEVAPKTCCGDGIVVLGLRTDVRADRMDCPPAKAAVMSSELSTMRTAAQMGTAVDREMVERNVGRLCNISQVDPSILTHIYAGYTLMHAVTRATRHAPRTRCRWLHLSPTGKVAVQFTAMVDASLASLAAERGVPLVPALAFPDGEEIGTITTVTDASGEDGAGGFAFVAGRPSEVWIVSAEWPPDIRAALARSATPLVVRARTPPAPVMSMPAGELLVPWAVAEALREQGIHVDHVLSVLDCRPAALTLSSAKSKSPLLRAILKEARSAVEQWLGVHVSRRLNRDADLLSHPASVQRVVRAAQAAGLTTHVIEGFPLHCWEAVRRALAECPWS